MESNSRPWFETGMVGEHPVDGFAFPGSLVLLAAGRLIASFIWRSRREKDNPYIRKDAGVIVFSQDGGRTWTEPEELFSLNQPFAETPPKDHYFGDPPTITMMAGQLYATCASQLSKPDSIDFSCSFTWFRTSDDSGKTWSPIAALHLNRKCITGMIQPGMPLPDGSFALSYSWDKSAEAGENIDNPEGTVYNSGVLKTYDGGKTWTAGGDAEVPADSPKTSKKEAINGVVEPTIAEMDDGTLYMLARTGTDHLWEATSHDSGLSWSPPRPSPLVSHNCPARLLKLKDKGGMMVVYNDHPTERARLCVRLSTDQCETWSVPKAFAPVGFIEEAQASYPQCCQLDDGTIVVIWCQKKGSDPSDRYRVFYARFNREWITS